ncbi:MAG: FUSC family protein [Paracoccus sp. (in: a-proteobacteria)]|uniref:FUSC family protein n=1 Tax=Paracoccus sp. TaxID=267 RepID=UPI0039E50F1C
MDPTFPWGLRALQLFAAAGISLALAVHLGLHNPFWAAMPVWVVAQPNRQDLVLRGLLRVLGTALGAALGYAALLFLPEAGPRLAVLALSLGAVAALAYWIGTAYSYGVLLAGITLAVVLVPAMDHPVDAAALAVDRIACTLIGVVAVTLITFAFTPRRALPLPPRRAPSRRMAANRGGIAALAAGLGGTLVLTIGGPAGIAAALSLCIFSLIICSARDPMPMLTYMPPGATIGVAAALAYRALDLHLPDPAATALVLALPFIALGAMLRSHPRSAPLGLDANMCFLLTAEAGTAGHGMAAHFQGGVALVLAAFGFTAFFRRIGRWRRG